MKEAVTKDSGERVGFDSGMVRDTEEGKPRMDLCVVSCMPYEEQLIVRYGMLRARGAAKYCETYTDINCEKAESEDELARYRSSAARHFFQWMCGEEDEDHAAAVLFNLDMHGMVKWKLKVKADELEERKVAQEIRAVRGNTRSREQAGHHGIDSLDKELQEHEGLILEAVRKRQEEITRRDEKVSE
jgi:hypothetical protein